MKVKLKENQNKIATFSSGTAMVDYISGCGATYALSRKCSNAIQSGILPEQIVILDFGDSVNNIQNKIYKYSGVYISVRTMRDFYSYNIGTTLKLICNEYPDYIHSIDNAENDYIYNIVSSYMWHKNIDTKFDKLYSLNNIEYTINNIFRDTKLLFILNFQLAKDFDVFFMKKIVPKVDTTLIFNNLGKQNSLMSNTIAYPNCNTKITLLYSFVHGKDKVTILNEIASSINLPFKLKPINSESSSKPSLAVVPNPEKQYELLVNEIIKLKTLDQTQGIIIGTSNQFNVSNIRNYLFEKGIYTNIDTTNKTISLCQKFLSNIFNIIKAHKQRSTDINTLQRDIICLIVAFDYKALFSKEYFEHDEYLCCIQSGDDCTTSEEYDLDPDYLISARNIYLEFLEFIECDRPCDYIRNFLKSVETIIKYHDSSVDAIELSCYLSTLNDRCTEHLLSWDNIELIFTERSADEVWIITYEKVLEHPRQNLILMDLISFNNALIFFDEHNIQNYYNEYGNESRYLQYMVYKCIAHSGKHLSLIFKSYVYKGLMPSNFFYQFTDCYKQPTHNGYYCTNYDTLHHMDNKAYAESFNLQYFTINEKKYLYW